MNNKKAITLLILTFALTGVQSAMGADGQKWQPALDKAVKEMEKGNHEVAQIALSKLVKKYPDAGALHTALGKAYKRLGKLDEAKAEFRAATEVEPAYAEAYYELGCMLESDEQWSAAADTFEKYLQLNPDASTRKTVVDRIRFCRNR